MKTCPDCFNGFLIDESDPRLRDAWDDAVDRAASGQLAAEEIMRRYPKAIRTCPKCKGKGVIPG